MSVCVWYCFGPNNSCALSQRETEKAPTGRINHKRRSVSWILKPHRLQNARIREIKVEPKWICIQSPEKFTACEKRATYNFQREEGIWFLHRVSFFWQVNGVSWKNKHKLTRSKTAKFALILLYWKYGQIYLFNTRLWKHNALICILLLFN